MHLCFAYDSILDYNQAVEENKDVVNRQKIFERLMVPHPIDLMVRTSG